MFVCLHWGIQIKVQQLHADSAPDGYDYFPPTDAPVTPSWGVPWTLKYPTGTLQ